MSLWVAGTVRDLIYWQHIKMISHSAEEGKKNYVIGRLDLSEYKHIHLDHLIRYMPDDQETLTISNKQHIGAPSVVTAQVGDKVVKGDCIARIKDGALGANIHASVDGEVVNIDDSGNISIKAMKHME